MATGRTRSHDDSDGDEPPRKKPRVRKQAPPKVPDDIQSITDLPGLVRLAENIKSQQGRRHKTQGLWKLSGCIDELNALNDLIGLKDLKDQVTKQIMFFILGLNDDEMMHTVISGPPGMAKTTVAEKLGLLYANLGFLSSGHVLTATRGDLIGQYLGETSMKTQMVLEASVGGILILDEAYALGDKAGRDSYSAECLNTINQFLSEHPEDFMCIVAGYEKELRSQFFASNPGLERRFTWWFRLQPYGMPDLVKILMYQITSKKWEYTPDVTEEWLNILMKDKTDMFRMNGGDTLILMDKCKIAHAQRVFVNTEEKHKCFTRSDIKEGLKMLELYKKNNGAKRLFAIDHMYV